MLEAHGTYVRDSALKRVTTALQMQQKVIRLAPAAVAALALTEAYELVSSMTWGNLAREVPTVRDYIDRSYDHLAVTDLFEAVTFGRGHQLAIAVGEHPGYETIGQRMGLPGVSGTEL